MSYKLLAVTLAAIALLGGCENARRRDKEEIQRNNPELSANKTVAILAVQPHHSIQDMNTNYVTTWMEGQTNVHVVWTIIPLKDADQKIELLFRGGNPLPDAIFTGEEAAFTPERTFQYGSKKLIIPIQSYIDEQAPRILELFDAYPGSRDWVTLSDGNIYGFGDFGRCPHCEHSQKLWINETWLNVLNLEMPSTVEEFYAVMKSFKNDDPNGNGRADEIPLAGGRINDGGSLDWRVNIDGFLMNPFIYNDGEDRIVIENTRVFPAYTDSRWREGLAFLRALFADGLLDAESFLQRSERVRSLVEGEVIRLGCAPGGTPSFFSNLLGDATKHYTVVPPLTGGDGTSFTGHYPAAGISVSPQFVITRDALDPGLIIRWIDFGLTREANFTRLRGEKDVDWRYAAPDEIGINGLPAVWKDKLGVDIESIQNKTWHGFPVAEWGIDQGLGLVADLHDPWEIEGRLYRASIAYQGHEPEKVAALLRIPPEDSGDYERMRLLINSYVDEWIARFVTGAADLDDDWEHYIQGINALGIDDYMDIVVHAVSAKYGETFSTP